MDYTYYMAMSSGQTMVVAALLIGLFWTALGHPDRIRSVMQFRAATFLVAFSLVVPIFAQFVTVGRQSAGNLSGGVSDDYLLLIVMAALPPVLNMFAIILGVGAVTPPLRQRKP